MICAALEDNTPVDLLRSQLAIESLHGSNQSVLEILNRIIPKTSEALLSYLTPIKGFVSSPDKDTIKNSEYRMTLQKVKALPFATYQDTLVQVPEGFTGHLDKYLETLLRIHSDLIAKANSVVLSYTDELAIFLNNVDQRKSIKSYESFYLKIRQERNNFNKMLASFFKKDSNQSRVKLGSVITRFGDLDSVFASAEKLEVAHRQSNLSDLMSNVNHAVALLDLLKTKIESDESLEVSGSMAQHISEGAYEAASYVELVSLACFNIEVALTTVQNLSKQFNTIVG